MRIIVEKRLNRWHNIKTLLIKGRGGLILKPRSKVVNLVVIFLFFIISTFIVNVKAQSRDDRRVPDLPKAPSFPYSAPSAPTVPNVPKPPTLPQLPVMPQTKTPPSLPMLPQLPTMPDTSGKVWTTIFSGVYAGMDIDEMGERKISVENALGERTEFLLTEDSKVFKEETLVSIDDITSGDPVVVHYEAIRNEDNEIEKRVLTSLFIVKEELEGKGDLEEENQDNLNTEGL